MMIKSSLCSAGITELGNLIFISGACGMDSGIVLYAFLLGWIGWMEI